MPKALLYEIENGCPSEQPFIVLSLDCCYRIERYLLVDDGLLDNEALGE